MSKANSVRIISGTHRGRRLAVLDEESLRPTADRVRETLFNWLSMDIQGANCLDLFAGTGALGLEAISRGAKQVCFVENNALACAQLVKVTELWSVVSNANVKRSNAMHFLADGSNIAYDLVFLDPPFSGEYLPLAVQLLREKGWLGQDALVYVEYAKGQYDLSLGEFSHWEIIKHKRAGQVEFALLRVVS